MINLEYPVVKDLCVENLRYLLLDSQHFPHQPDNRPWKEKILSEAVPYLRQMATESEEWLEGNSIKLSLCVISQFSRIQELGVDLQQIW